MIDSNSVTLRPLQRDDIPSINSWRNDFQTKELLNLHPFPVSLEQDLDWFDSLVAKPDDRSVYFAIERKDEAQLIGYCNLRDVNLVHRHAELGIFLDRKHARNGFGTEVLRSLVSYAFRYLNLERIYINVLSINEAALKFFAAFGFTEEGRMRSHVCVGNSRNDIVIMGLLAGEYKHDA